MITIDELCQVVASIGLPWAQVGFERGDDVQPPFTGGQRRERRSRYN